MAIQTSIPGILWLPGVDHYEISVYFSYNQSFIHDVKPSIQGVVSEHAFSINCTLYVNGNPYQRKIEDRLMVKKESEKRIQSFSFNLKDVYEDFSFLPDALRREENCYLECSLTTMDGFFEKMPLSPPFWLKAWKEGSFFYYPAIPTHGVRASSLVPGKTRFCEQFPAITYEPTRDMTTALAIVNPRKRAIRVTVQMFPESEGRDEHVFELPAHMVRVLRLHEHFDLQGRERNSGVLVLSEHRPIIYSAHMNISGNEIYSVDHTDAWRTEETQKSAVPLSLYWRMKIAKALVKGRGFIS